VHDCVPWCAQFVLDRTRGAEEMTATTEAAKEQKTAAKPGKTGRKSTTRKAAPKKTNGKAVARKKAPAKAKASTKRSNAARQAGEAALAKAKSKTKPAARKSAVAARDKAKAATAGKSVKPKQAVAAPGSTVAQIPPGPNPAAAVLGEVNWLMTRSPAHKHLFIADMEWLVAPAIMLKQFRIWHQEGTPVAYASWAFLSEEAEQRLLSGVRKLSPGDWNSGDRAWLIDLVAPHGGGEGFLANLKQKVFADRELKTLRPDPDGNGAKAEVVSGGGG